MNCAKKNLNKLPLNLVCPKPIKCDDNSASSSKCKKNKSFGVEHDCCCFQPGQNDIVTDNAGPCQMIASKDGTFTNVPQPFESDGNGAGQKNIIPCGTNNVASGGNATVISGLSNVASGKNSMAGGINNKSRGDNCFTCGFGNTIDPANSTAFGIGNNISLGEQAFVLGSSNNLIQGENGMMWGRNNIMNAGNSATVWGFQNIGIGQQSTTFGANCISEGSQSTTFGESNIIENGDNCSILGGQRNKIDTLTILNVEDPSRGSNNTIVGGINNTITNQLTTESAIIGGAFNKIDGFKRSVILGCTGQVATKDDTVYMCKLHFDLNLLPSGPPEPPGLVNGDVWVDTSDISNNGAILRVKVQ